MKMKDKQEQISDVAQKVFAVIGAVVGAVTAFMLGGETWGWLWVLVFTPVGAVVGRFCGWLFTVSTKNISNIFWIM